MSSYAHVFQHEIFSKKLFFVNYLYIKDIIFPFKNLLLENLIYINFTQNLSNRISNKPWKN